eukprot:m.98531 g.98531  ORF g.98531 m.98531 type:complete len:143 (-) comp27075_c0_seq1:118-546(-)
MATTETATAVTHSATSNNPKKIFIGNLKFSTTSKDLEKLCSPIGEVEGAKVILDRGSNQPKGFGFVTFTQAANAARAVSMLNGSTMQGRPLTVRMATQRGTGAVGLQDDDDLMDPILRSSLNAEKVKRSTKTSTLPGWGDWN